MKKLNLSLLAVSIVFSTGVSAQVAVESPGPAHAYWLVPISQAQTPPAFPTIAPSPAGIAPVAATPSGYWWGHTSFPSTDNLDRLVAAASTFGELRVLLGNAARLRQVRQDPLLVAFIRERVTAPSLESLSGLNTPYRVWLVETLLEYGDRLGATEQIPSFALLPANAAASWPAIWRRSYAPWIDSYWGFSTAQPLGGHPHVHVRELASTHGRILARLTRGEEARVLEEAGNWRRVQTRDGLTGYVLAAELSVRAPSAAPYHGAESITHWERSNAGEGYYSPYGWVRPPWTQVREASGGR